MYVGGLGGRRKNGLESEYAAVNLPESSRKLWRDESSKRCRCSELEELPRERMKTEDKKDYDLLPKLGLAATVPKKRVQKKLLSRRTRAVS